MERNAWAGAVIVTGLCFALRTVELGAKSLWIDEIWSLRIAELSWNGFGRAILEFDPNSSLYYAFLHLWIHLGKSEVMLRFPSVLFATATIPIIFLLSTKLAGRMSGLIAALLVSINMFHLQWSQETRGYAMLVFLVSLASWLFVRCVEAPSLSRWTVYSLVCTAAVYVHLYALLVVLAHGLSLFLLRPRNIPWRGWLFSGALLGVLTSPLLYLISVRAKAPMFPLDWLPRLSPYLLYKSAHQMSGNPHYEGVKGGDLLLLLAFILCLLASLAALECFHQCHRSMDLWRAGLPLCWLVLPPTLMFFQSLAQPMFVYRYLLVSLPAMALTMANGVMRIRSRWGSFAGTVLLLTLSLPGMARYYRYRAAFGEWRTVTQKIAAEAQPGDGIIYCVAPGRLLVDYYARQLAFESTFPRALYPDSPDFHHDPYSIAYLPPWDDEQMQSDAETHPRIWLVLHHDFFKTTQDARDRLRTILGKRFAESSATKIDGVTVELYSQPATIKDADSRSFKRVADSTLQPRKGGTE